MSLVNGVERKCKDCEFWYRKNPDSKAGECREGSPQVLMIPTNVRGPAGEIGFSVNGFFPPTGPEICCGKMKPRVD